MDKYENLIKALRNVSEYDSDYAKLMYDAADAIEALSKMEKTTQQGERLIPKKPKMPVDTWVCPVCGRDVEFQMMIWDNIIFHGRNDICPHCGQAIDWEGE